MSAIRSSSHKTALQSYPLPQCFEPLLLGMRIYVSANDERQNIEERNPSLLRQELLRKRQRQRARNPADAHDGPETRADRSTDLMPSTRASDEGHAGKVDGVLDRRDDQVAGEDLQDLRTQRGASREEALQHGDEDVAEWSADEGAVGGHLGHARGKVVPVFAAVVGEPAGEHFLEGGEGAGGEHFGAQGVGLELFEVSLDQVC